MSNYFNEKNITRFISISFIASIVFIVIRIIIAPVTAPPSDVIIRVKGDYALLLFKCTAGLVALNIPRWLRQKFGLNIPSVMIIVYVVFLYCGIYLGEFRNFYYLIPHWDTILHIFSGVTLGALGFSIVSLLNKSESVAFSLSPVFVALFSFCFALSLGVIWEFFEFAMDCLADGNSQRNALESGELLIGQAALMDTMKDLIVDAAGAFVMSTIGFISLKYDKNWLVKLQVKKAA